MAKDPQRIRQALFAAIAAVVPDILDCPADIAPFYRVTAEGRSGFAAIPELRRRFPGAFPGSRWTQVSEMVRLAFMAEAPDHVDNLVGTATGGAVRLHAEDWVRYGVTAVLGATDFNVPTETEITAVVDHLVAFVRSPRVALRFLAPLLNLESDPATTIPFGHGISLRRFTDDELTLLYGGTIGGGQRWRTPTWGFVEDFEDVKHIGVVDIDTAMSDYPLVIPRLERAVLSLRTFKGGAVGIEAVHFVPIGFHPMGLSIARTEFHEFVPFWHYGISEDEVVDLTEHAELMNATLHPSMEMVASRLAFASMRTHSSDRILDAVIGLEGVLLAQMGEDVRGENRFRFSLNYAMLSG